MLGSGVYIAEVVCVSKFYKVKLACAGSFKLERLAPDSFQASTDFW